MAAPLFSKLLLLGALVGLSAFFSAAETALFSLRKAELHRLRQRRPARGEIVLFLLDHPRRVLSTLWLGNATVNTAACVLALSLASNELFFSILVMILVLLLIGEIVPKTFAIQKPGLTVKLAARPIYWLTQLSAPLRGLLEGLGYWMVRWLTPATYRPRPHITEDEFRAMVEIGQEQGTLQESERRMINAIMKLDEKTVKDVMTPRVDMICLPDNLSQEEITGFLKKMKHRRVPVFDETPDTVIGI